MQPEKVVNGHSTYSRMRIRRHTSHGWKSRRGAVVLRTFALADEAPVLAALDEVIAERLDHMITPSGFRMSVALTNCGSYGWVTDPPLRCKRVIQIVAKPPCMPDVFRRWRRCCCHRRFEISSSTRASSISISRG
jgi:alkylated DNA repair protein (DNA oxidative demethylase)